MSPSRGDVSSGCAVELEGDSSEEMREARLQLRKLLAGLHVLDALPERSRMLAVDADIPVQRILSTVVSEQHLRSVAPGSVAAMGAAANLRRPPGTLSSGADGCQGDRWAEPRGGLGGRGHNGIEVDASGAEQMRREGAPSQDGLADELNCGIVPPSLPSNVLAEVCEFEPVSLGDPMPPVAEERTDNENEPAVRRWTSPDDGWGMQQPMQDLEKMPMGMPVTIGELADFLACACASPGPKHEGSTERWAEPRINSTKPDGNGEDTDGGGDMLDWSLTEWRCACLRKALRDSPSTQSTTDGSMDFQTRFFVEERPQAFVGPVLVHRVEPAPPRPILCTDDPEASLLKAVQLLLAYPELDAVPIVSPVRCTVVAHLTLSYCLAYVLNRLRGPDILSLADLKVQCRSLGSGASQRLYDGRDIGGGAAAPEYASKVPWVLSKSQPLHKLLLFFARTHHSGVPIVEDTPEGSDVGGGVLGLLSRRDLLQFLDLAMQSATRREEAPEVAGANSDKSATSAKEIVFDIAAPVEVMLDALRRHRGNTDEVAAGLAASYGGGTPPANSCVGASFVYEKELTLKQVLLRVLAAENRKLLFVQDGEGGAPNLTRILSVSDVWLLLIGKEQEPTSLQGAA